MLPGKSVGHCLQSNAGRYFAHPPKMQNSSTLHVVPQAPQFSWLVLRSKQPKPVLPLAGQTVSEAAHTEPHVRFRQPEGQGEASRQFPQWSGSLSISTHATPEHFVRPGLHVHFPATQYSESLQTTPQPPQFFGSINFTVQVSGHTSAAGTPQMQADELQY